MGQQKGADQTEKPTPKKLRDARKEGDVSKSRELTSTVLLMLWLAIAWLMTPFMFRRLELLFEQSLGQIGKPFAEALPMLAVLSVEVFVWLTIPMLLLAVIVGAFVEFLQVGAVFAPKKVLPKLQNLNPVEGVKRMFSLRNLVEVVKSVAKAGILVALGWLVIRALLPEIVELASASPGAFGKAFWTGMFRISFWVIFLFFFVSVLDISYQRFEYTKQLRMSRRDIRQELKENEGDPMIKSQRKQLHQEWAQQNMLHSVRQSNVVVTNPTHIAVALLYDPDQTDLPVVVAKGEDYEAKLIREAAEEAGVPIMQNVQLARSLHEKVELEEYITEEFFTAVAEVLKWADALTEEERRNAVYRDQSLEQGP